MLHSWPRRPEAREPKVPKGAKRRGARRKVAIAGRKRLMQALVDALRPSARRRRNALRRRVSEDPNSKQRMFPPSWMSRVGVPSSAPSAPPWPRAEYATEVVVSPLGGAYAAHPERFIRTTPRQPEVPTAVGINRPAASPTDESVDSPATCLNPLDKFRVDGSNGSVPILPKERDPRLITIRRGGTLTDEHHRLLADWALLCAEHVLHLFEDHPSGDSRPRDAINVGRAWIRGEVRMGDAHRAAFQANAAARGMADPAKFAALSVGQAVAVAHVAAHDLGAAAYAIRAAGACVPADDAAQARAKERGWQREHLPAAIRELVLDDQQRRSAICWHVFNDCSQACHSSALPRSVVHRPCSAQRCHLEVDQDGRK